MKLYFITQMLRVYKFNLILSATLYKEAKRKKRKNPQQNERHFLNHVVVLTLVLMQ